MKIIVFAILLIAVFGASMVEKDGQLHFEADSHPESPIGMLMKGFVDPKDEGANSVQTFLRLAEQLIPLAQSKVNEKPGSLTYFRQWCTGAVGDAFNVCIFVNAELYIGWRVSQVGFTGSYNVTYTPFTLFRAGANASASSYPAEVSYGAYFSIVDIQVPVNLLLAQSQICYSARFAMLPTAAYTAIAANLLQCERSIPDMTPWMCSKITGAEFRHLEWDFTDAMFINLLPYTCFNF